MIRSVIRQAWKRDPLAVLLSIPAAILAVLIVWLVLVVAIVAGTPA